MTHEELCTYFSSPMYEEELPYIAEIMRSVPDLGDERLISIAANFMLQADEEAVKLSVHDALRLAGAFKAKPVSEILQQLTDAGIKDWDAMETILEKALNAPAPKSAGFPAVSAAEKAEKLKDLAVRLAQNQDIILLGLPVFQPEMNSAWVKLAVLGGELAAEEQGIIMEMRDIADKSEVKTESGIVKLLFRIKNVRG